MAKRTEVDGDPRAGKPGAIGEIGKEPIEPVDENMWKDAAKLEEFMNQPILIRVAEDNSKESLPVITPSVNGVNQPIIRGQKIWIKRKYVEALARGTMTRYEQQVQDPSKPENIQMLPKTAVVYPFTVYEDPDPNGPRWLENIMKETA